MGDKADAWIYCRKEDVKEIADILGEYDEIDADPDFFPDKLFRLTFREVNDGMIDAFQGLANRGFTFFGGHYEGAEYDACDFVGHEGRLLLITTTSQIGPVVPVTEDGPVQEELESAKEYFDFLKNVKEVFEKSSK